MNIVDLILYQCRRQPPAAAICAPGSGIDLISYRHLERAIHNVSRRLHGFGLPRGGVVAVTIDDVTFHAIVLLAAIRLGMITLSLGASDVPPFAVDVLVCLAKRPTALPAGRTLVADQTWLEGDGRPLEPHLLPATDGNDICRLILTSGTSSTAKAVPLTHDLLARRMARHVTFGNRLANCSRIYSDVPIGSSLGFQFFIHALSRGGLAVFAGDDFYSTLRVIEDCRVECLVGSPGGFENFLRWVEETPSYQTNIKVIVCAGDVLSPSLSARLRSRICSHLVSIYGSTEVSMSAVANGHEISAIPRAVGFVTPGVTIQIIDAAGALLPPGQEGRLRIKSEFSAGGYFRNPDETAKVFRDGWFYPGDLGTLDADGLLIITGREHAVLNLGGDKVSPELIEAALTQFPGIVEAAAVAMPNAFGNNEVCAVLVAHEKIDPRVLREYCATRVPRQFMPVRYVFVEAIPRNENGKVDRRRLQESIARTSSPAA